MNLDENFEKVLGRVAELRALMAQGTLSPDAYTAYSKEYAELEPVAERIEAVKAARRERVGSGNARAG